jgi:cell division septation protein DedD
VAELSHDTADDGFHEIQLSGKQIVFLFMVLTVASAVIFLMGVLVGRSVPADRGDDAAQVTAPASASPQPVAEGLPASEPPAPASETPDELSYHKRLQGERAPQEAVKPEQPKPAAPDTSAPPPAAQETSAPKPAAAAPEGGRPGAWVVQVGAFGNASAARDVVRKLAEKGHPAFLVNPAPGMPAIYRVQVGGYTSRSEADQIARRIEKEDQFKPVVRQNR